VVEVGMKSGKIISTEGYIQRGEMHNVQKDPSHCATIIVMVRSGSSYCLAVGRCVGEVDSQRETDAAPRPVVWLSQPLESFSTT
jgi:hypothetical protein